MRIAYDHQILGMQVYGGISRYYLELVRRISAPPDVDAMMVSPLHVNKYAAAPHDPVRILGLKVPSVRGWGFLCGKINPPLSRCALRILAPDIVHETYYSDVTVAPAGSKIVLTIFDMIHERFPGNFSRRDTTAAKKQASARRADHVICISEQTKQDVIELLRVPASEISVIQLAASLPEPQLQHTATPAHPYILYVGDRYGYKNFNSLLAAYAATPQLRAGFRLVVFGGGSFTSAEKAAIRHQNLHPEKVMHVQGDDTLLASMYARAALFVYPSLYEGFGIPVLEAMHCGCPVICSGISPMTDVAGPAALFFDPSSVESIAEAATQVLYDSELREKLIAAGRPRAASFSWSRCAAETLGVYRNLLTR